MERIDMMKCILDTISSEPGLSVSPGQILEDECPILDSTYRFQSENVDRSNEGSVIDEYWQEYPMVWYLA